MRAEEALIIFSKNPEFGQVKTRLAKTIGPTNALRVYRYLLEYTKNIALECPVDRVVMYSDFIDFEDIFPAHEFTKDLQEGDDLGERMMMALGACFEEGYKKVVIIGSDCYEITSEHIMDAFFALDKNDLVMGPAQDGGYYLIGMKESHDKLFLQKTWSSPDVFVDTLLDAKALGLSYHLLPTLSDIDEEKDLGDLNKLISQ